MLINNDSAVLIESFLNDDRDKQEVLIASLAPTDEKLVCELRRLKNLMDIGVQIEIIFCCCVGQGDYTYVVNKKVPAKWFELAGEPISVGRINDCDLYASTFYMDECDCIFPHTL